MKAVGPLAFGPEDLLFVADNVGATITAIDVEDTGVAGSPAAFDLDDLDTKLASFLGCQPDDIIVCDLVVHPRTHNLYLSVMRGRGDEATPVIVRIDTRSGALGDVPLEDVSFSQVALEDAPAPDGEPGDFQLGGRGEGQRMELPDGRTIYLSRVPARTSTVTDMAFVDGLLLVAGMSNEEFSSTFRRIPVPFSGDQVSTSLEIFHVSHGMWETAAPIRTFVPFEGGRSVLASYTCTPLVHFPLAGLSAGTKATGRTVAELGFGNQPLDMVSFTQEGEEYLLISNSNRPAVKINTKDIGTQEALTTPQEPVGVPRQTIDLPGITKMDKLNGEYIIALQRDEDGTRRLRSLKTASL
jgi:hypothetical protein